MLEGQSCLLPALLFHAEDSPLIRFITCRAEASAETSPNFNPNPHPNHSESDEVCPCSPAAQVEIESNHGELPDLNISWACHCSSVQFVEADATQKWVSNGQLTEQGTIPHVSSQCDCSSTSSLIRSAVVLPLFSVKGAKEGAPKTGGGDDKLEVVGASRCIFSEFGSTFIRSFQGEGTFSKVLGENEMVMDFAEAASSIMICEEEGLSRSEDGEREGKRTDFLRNWEDAEASDIKKGDIRVEDSGMIQKISWFIDNNENFLGLACAGKNCSKLTGESCSELASAEKIPVQRSSFKCSVSQGDNFESSCAKGCKIMRCIKTSQETLPEKTTSFANRESAEKVPIQHSSFECSVTEGDNFKSSCAKGCKKLKILGCNMTSHDTLPENAKLHANREMASSSDDGQTSQQQPYLPSLDNESALRCLALVPFSDLGRLSRVCRQYRDLVKSRLILKLRQTYGMVEHFVFIYASIGGWIAYDASRNLWWPLPPANVEHAFVLSDKESLSAGTHVLWFGKEMIKEVFDFVYYRYDLLTNSWERGPSMINPRCLFASASCGEFAFVAGGFGPADSSGVLSLLNSAERYNSWTGQWERLPPMSTPRQKCSGFFMDGKFYVIGGRDGNHQPIMSGEEYNPSTGVWRTIPDMYFAPEIAHMYEPSPPLVAAVNDQLYAVEITTNTLKIYNKHNNTWSNLRYLPVLANRRNGWGVAFKALGDKLFVMGDREGIEAYWWQPGSNADWELLSHRERGANSFLYNCAVMNC